MTQDEITRRVQTEVKESDRIKLNLKETKVVIDTYLILAADVLEGEGRIVVPHIGILKIKEQKERNGHNPQTGEKIVIPAQNRVKFTPAKSLKDAVNS